MCDTKAVFDDYARRTIRHKVRPLIGILGFREVDREDLEQEVALHLVRRLPGYDSRKGTVKTFITMVVDSKIKTIIRLRKLRDRAFDNPDCSLNDEVSDGGGETMERMDALDSEEHMMRLGLISKGSTERAEMRADIERVLTRLPERLQEICIRLQTQNVTEISAEMGVSRQKIYEYIHLLREIFDEAGLRAYL